MILIRCLILKSKQVRFHLFSVINNIISTTSICHTPHKSWVGCNIGYHPSRNQKTRTISIHIYPAFSCYYFHHISINAPYLYLQCVFVMCMSSSCYVTIVAMLLVTMTSTWLAHKSVLYGVSADSAQSRLAKFQFFSVVTEQCTVRCIQPSLQ